MTKNPYIEPENPYQQYNESIQKLKNNPEVIEFDKLCYELFGESVQGKKFIEVIKNRYLIPTLTNRNDTNFANTCIYVEGFREAFRLLINSVESHSQRIKAETNKA